MEVLEREVQFHDLVPGITYELPQKRLQLMIGRDSIKMVHVHPTEQRHEDMQTTIILHHYKSCREKPLRQRLQRFCREWKFTLDKFFEWLLTYWTAMQKALKAEGFQIIRKKAVKKRRILPYFQQFLRDYRQAQDYAHAVAMEVDEKEQDCICTDAVYIRFPYFAASIGAVNLFMHGPLYERETHREFGKGYRLLPENAGYGNRRRAAAYNMYQYLSGCGYDVQYWSKQTILR